MVQIQRRRSRSTTKTWKWGYHALNSKFKLTTHRIILLFLFLISMLTLGIKVGLVISQYSLVAHDNAILASYHNNNNNNNNNNHDHNHNHNDVTEKIGRVRVNEKQQHKHKHKGPTTNTNKNDTDNNHVADANIADVDVVTTDAEMDDHVRTEMAEELVHQFVQWMNYPFLQELKEQHGYDVVEAVQGDEKEQKYIAFTSFAVNAQRTYTLLQEGMELLDTYHTVQAIDQKNHNHADGHDEGDTTIDALLGEVDITEEMVITILTKLKKIVTQALETTTSSPDNTSNSNNVTQSKEKKEEHKNENEFDIPALTDRGGEKEEDGAARDPRDHPPPPRDPKRGIPPKRTTTVDHHQQEKMRRNRNRVIATIESESEGQQHHNPSSHNNNNYDPDLKHDRGHQHRFRRRHENDEDFGELSSHYCSSSDSDSTVSSNGNGNAKGTNSSTTTTTTKETTKESTITTIVLRGERHCGTKWIRSILEQNLRRSMYINQDDPKYGWKHGFLPPLGWGERIETESVLLLVVTRDIFTWLPKMYEEAYDTPTKHYKEKHQLSFSQFIRTQYGALCHPAPGENREFYRQRKERQEDFCSKLLVDQDATLQQKLYDADGDSATTTADTDDFYLGTNTTVPGVFDIETSMTERANNIIQIRTQKYKQWLRTDLDEQTFRGTQQEFNTNRVLINLESLVVVAPPNTSSSSTSTSTNNTNNNDNTVHKNAQELAFQLQEKILGTPLDTHCIKRMKKFQGITERVTFNDSKGPNFINRGNKKKQRKKEEQVTTRAPHEQERQHTTTNKKHSKKQTANQNHHRRLFQQNENTDIVVDTGGGDHDHDHHSIRKEAKIQKIVPTKHHICRHGHGHGQQNRHEAAEEKKQLQEKVYKTTTHDEHVIPRKQWNPRKRKRNPFDKPGAYDAYTEKQKSLSKYTKEDLQFILEQVDLEFELSIGYDYDYIYDMLDKDDFEGHDGWNDNTNGSGSSEGSGSGKGDGGL